jgi:hypothetical protein
MEFECGYLVEECLNCSLRRCKYEGIRASKLTDEDIFEIKQLLSDMRDMTFIADMLNISRKTVQRVKNGRYATTNKK